MTDAEILFTRKGLLGLVTLNRPKALNALTLGMIRRLHSQLRAWAADPEVKAVVVQGAGEKAFCAGGDVMKLYQTGKDAPERLGNAPAVQEFFREEYVLNRLIKRYPKPYVALMDGVTMGGGVGLSEHGSHRIGTERLLYAMPETAIGIFPDVGGSYFLPRCPGKLGLFLGLTGERLKASDCLYAGLIDAYVPSAKLDALVEDLAAMADGHAVVSSTIARHADAPDKPPLAVHRAAIDRCFGHGSLEAILAALEAENTEWADGVRATLLAMAPTSLKVTQEAIRRGAGLEFEDCMTMEYRLSQALLAAPNFYEGVRALLVDKDRSPHWQPATVEDVSDAEVERYFQPPPHGDLLFAN